MCIRDRFKWLVVFGVRIARLAMLSSPDWMTWGKTASTIHPFSMQTGGILKMPSSNPVSYTHLDVYKRQVVTLADTLTWVVRYFITHYLFMSVTIGIHITYVRIFTWRIYFRQISVFSATVIELRCKYIQITEHFVRKVLSSITCALLIEFLGFHGGRQHSWNWYYSGW